MNEHTNQRAKMGRQSTSKERKATRPQRGESKYRLELLEPRLLLSADIVAAVPAAPLSTPPPTITVAEILAQSSSSFPQVASAVSRLSHQTGGEPSMPQSQTGQAPWGAHLLDGGPIAGKHHMSIAHLLAHPSLLKSGPSANLPGSQDPSPVPATQTSTVIQPTTPTAEVTSSSDTATTETIAAPVIGMAPPPSEALPDTAGSLQLPTITAPDTAEEQSTASTPLMPVADLLPQPSVLKNGSSVDLPGSQDPAPVPATQTSTVIQPTTPTAEVTSSSDTATTETIAAPVIGMAPPPSEALPDTAGSLQLPTITAPDTAGGQSIASTLLNQWQQQMVTFGQQHANELSGLTGQAARDATYYDAARVFYQIADYTHDPSWLAPAHQAITIYRDQYVIPNNGAVPGYWNFTGGLLQDFQHTGDVRSKDAIIMLSQNADFAPDTTPLAWTAGTDASREVSYTIMNYLNAEAVGAPHRPRLDDLVTQALGHLDQWFVSKTAPYLQPFMAGLTMDALIQYDTAVGGDPRILPAIQTAVNSLWTNNWISGSQAFQYMDRDMGSLGGPTPANDLNMLIAPAYAWMYHKTGNVIYQQQADAIFSGAVNGAYLNEAKQFDQNYMLAFDFMNWRNG